MVGSLIGIQRNSRLSYLEHENCWFDDCLYHDLQGNRASPSIRKSGTVAPGSGCWVGGELGTMQLALCAPRCNTGSVPMSLVKTNTSASPVSFYMWNGRGWHTPPLGSKQPQYDFAWGYILWAAVTDVTVHQNDLMGLSLSYLALDGNYIPVLQLQKGWFPCLFQSRPPFPWQ